MEEEGVATTMGGRREREENAKVSFPRRRAHAPSPSPPLPPLFPPLLPSSRSKHIALTQ